MAGRRKTKKDLGNAVPLKDEERTRNRETEKEQESGSRRGRLL